MKKIISTTSLLVLSIFLAAQDCGNFYYLQNNKTVEMTIYNRKDKADGIITYHISDVSKTGGSTAATIQSEMVNDKGKSLSKSTIKA